MRSLVCAGLVQFLAVTPERLQTHLRELIQYMLQATQVRLRRDRFPLPVTWDTGV